MTHDTTSRSSPHEGEIKPTRTRRTGKGQPQVAPSRPPFAPVPRALIRNPRVSAEAIRLWAVLDALAFEQAPPEIAILQARMLTERPDKDGQIVRKVPSQASVYRWLKELEQGDGLRWDRNADLGDRFTLLDGTPEGEAERVLRQLRALMRQLQRATTAEEHETTLAAMAKILTGEKLSLTGENETPTSENPSLTGESDFPTDESPTPARGNPNHVYRDKHQTHETSSDTMPTHPPAVGDDVPTPTELFLREENLGIAKELRLIPLDMAQRYVADAKQRGATLPAIAQGLRARWKREQTRQREQAAATRPPGWIDDTVWPTLPDELQIALEQTEIDDEGYLCYDGRHEAAIQAYGDRINTLMAQARREQVIGAVEG